MNNVDLFNLITCELFARGQECFPLPVEANFKDFFKGGDAFTEAAVFKHTLLWLQDNGYIKVSPPISDKEDVYSVTFTEKSVAKWHLPTSLENTSVIDMIKSAAKTCSKAALTSAVSELIRSAIR